MRILYIHNTYRFPGGEDKVLETESGLLKDNGHEIKIIKACNNHNRLTTIINLTVQFFNPYYFLLVLCRIKKYNPDVIHVHNWLYTASPSIFWACHFSKKPVVHTLHNFRLLCPSATLFTNGKVFCDSLKGGFPWAAVNKRVYRKSYLLTFLLAANVRINKLIGTWKLISSYIVLTDFAKQIFSRSDLDIANRLIVKPNCVCDPGTDDNAPDRDETLFLYIGRLTAEKGIMVLLDAFKNINAKLLLIGDGPLQQDVVKFVANHKHITYAGSLDHSHIIKLLKNCSALIFPSIWYEGMPLTIIESLSCGNCVIASDMGAMASMINDNVNGLLFNPGDAVDLNAKINHWIKKSTVEKNLLRKNARKDYIYKYTPGANYAELIDIYHSAITHKYA